MKTFTKKEHELILIALEEHYDNLQYNELSQKDLEKQQKLLKSAIEKWENITYTDIGKKIISSTENYID